MKASEWIDLARSRKGLPSDYAVAKEMGLSRFTVSGYRRRPDATLDEEICLKLASFLGEKPETILADQAWERARSEPARTAWATVLERLRTAPSAMAGYSTPLFMVLIFAITFIASGAVLARASDQSSSDQSELYISSVTKYTSY